MCNCEFDTYPDDLEMESWHFKRTCLTCGYVWFSLHCPHDGIQRLCPECHTRPIPIPDLD